MRSWQADRHLPRYCRIKNMCAINVGRWLSSLAHDFSVPVCMHCRWWFLIRTHAHDGAGLFWCDKCLVGLNSLLKDGWKIIHYFVFSTIYWVTIGCGFKYVYFTPIWGKITKSTDGLEMGGSYRIIVPFSGEILQDMRRQLTRKTRLLNWCKDHECWSSTDVDQNGPGILSLSYKLREVEQKKAISLQLYQHTWSISFIWLWVLFVYFKKVYLHFISVYTSKQLLVYPPGTDHIFP